MYHLVNTTTLSLKRMRRLSYPFSLLLALLFLFTSNLSGYAQAEEQQGETIVEICSQEEISDEQIDSIANWVLQNHDSEPAQKCHSLLSPKTRDRVIIAIWALQGITPEELTRDVEEMKEGGDGGEAYWTQMIGCVK